MAKLRNEYVEYITDLLHPFGISNVRAMFGGYGIYKNGIIFAIIADNELYFKGDKITEHFFQEQGSQPFTYIAKGKEYKMSYWHVPPEMLDDPDRLQTWFAMAYQAGVSAKKLK